MKFILFLIIFNLTASRLYAKYVYGSSKYNIHDISHHPFFTDAPDDVNNIVTEEWIEQRLDHFDPQNDKTFLGRYLSNLEFLQEGSPIFIFVGGEWSIFPGHIISGHLHDMARELNAVLFYTEHRYYGHTLPTEDLRTENLKYLSVDQALEDLAHFIKFKKAQISQIRNSKVILIGGQSKNNNFVCEIKIDFYSFIHRNVGHMVQKKISSLG
jgi:Serine carboxypeptidase S28